MRILPAVIVVAGIVLWMCRPEEKELDRYVPDIGDGKTTPTMSTSDVSTFISDSGYTKYKVVAPLWQMFEDADDPFWRFPYGIHLEQYNTEMEPKSSVEADSAVYFSHKRLWRLDGNVVMANTSADSFLTQQLFWDQTQRKIYSDSFIHIVRSDRIIEGYGFESDQGMEAYSVNRPTAILPGNMRRQKKEPTDSTAPSADSAVVRAPAAPGGRIRQPRAGAVDAKARTQPAGGSDEKFKVPQERRKLTPSRTTDNKSE